MDRFAFPEERKMKKLAVVLGLVAFVSVTPFSHAQDIARFAPLKAEELTLSQKAWADALAAPREVRQSALSRLYPQPGARAKTDRAGRPSALEYIAAASTERTGNPDHGAGMHGAVRIACALSDTAQGRPRPQSGRRHRRRRAP